MNAETAAAWAAWIAAAVTAGSVFVAVRANRHSKEAVAEARRSADAAERSITAAEKAANEARRSADAAERQAAAAEKMIPPPQPTVAWQVSKLGESYYALRNVGTDPAENVTIEAVDNPPGTIQITPEPVRVLPGMTIRAFLPGWAELNPVDELIVSWDRLPAPEVVPLPPE
jgi:hypothetical protein